MPFNISAAERYMENRKITLAIEQKDLSTVPSQTLGSEPPEIATLNSPRSLIARRADNNTWSDAREDIFCLVPERTNRCESTVGDTYHSRLTDGKYDLRWLRWLKTPLFNK